MKLKQFIMDDNVQQEFLEYAKPFIDKAIELGFTYSGVTSSALSMEEGIDPEANMITLYFYRGYSPTPTHIMELLDEYAESIFLDEATNVISINRVSRYLAVTIIASL